MRTRIKICGLTRHEDAIFCASAGVDAIGLVFYPPSSRNLSAEQALAVTYDLPPFLTRVGLFMNATVAEVEQVIDQVPLDLLQFHGQEDGTFCQRFSLPYIKAIPMGDDAPDFERLAEKYQGAQAFLLDSHTQTTAGGSGKIFNWDNVPAASTKPLVLAGGLAPDNVQSAIRKVRPYAVDCSSGVESKPGIKDHGKIQQFMENVADV